MRAAAPSLVQDIRRLGAFEATRECACGECRFKPEDERGCPKLRGLTREERAALKTRRQLWARDYDAVRPR